MSTYWQLECRDCGRGTDWGQNYATRNAGHLLVPLCKNGILGKLIELAHDFRVAHGVDDTLWHAAIHDDCSDLRIDLASSFSRECAQHRIWPMDEYGEWLGADHFLSPLDDKTRKLLEGGPGPKDFRDDEDNIL